jgi:mRNA interferase YafQ
MENHTRMQKSFLQTWILIKMYLIRKTKSFEKSFRKIRNSGIKESIFKDLGFVVDLLAGGKNLPVSYRDHNLNGELSDCKECHIKGDLLLVYKIKKEELILVLIDIGSHSQLF